jgi:site-specific DNA-methyltransferase (adenine-specific)
MPRNPRRLTDEQRAQLTESIQKFNLVEIPVIDRDNTIIAGHQRVSILIALGRQDETIEVRMPSRKLTDAERREYNIRSNKNTGEWDTDILREDFSALELQSFGFSMPELKDLRIEVEPDVKQDEIPKPPRKVRTKVGDLYELGNHRLLCGDSRNAEHVKRLMNGKTAKLFATDPPYGVNYSRTKDGIPGSGFANQMAKWGDIQADKLKDLELQKFLEECFRVWLPYLERAAWYLWHAYQTQGFFAAAAAAADVIVHRQIIWAKPGFVLTRSGMYHWAHELCFFGWVRGNPPAWYGDKSQKTVWNFDRDRSAKIHPTQKPVELFAIPIKNHTKEGDIVAEPFAGSGSQLIAAEQLNRCCYAMEIEPKYCDVIVQRWVNFTQNEHIKLNGKKILWKGNSSC